MYKAMASIAIAILAILTLGIARSTAEEDFNNFYCNNSPNISTTLFNQESGCQPKKDGQKCEYCPLQLQPHYVQIILLNIDHRFGFYVRCSVDNVLSSYLEGIMCYMGTGDNIKQRKINCTVGCAKIVRE